MKSKVLRKVLVSALAISLVMAPAVSVSASGTGSGGGTISGNDNGGSGSGTVTDQTNGETVTVAEIPTIGKVTAGGKVITSTTAGIYLAKGISGAAITTDIATISAGYGLAGSEKPYAKITDMDKKKSPMAMASINAAAEGIGATVGPCLNIELGKLSAGKYSLLAQDGADIRLAFGIPKNFTQDGVIYAVICVRPGGAVSILKDVDDNPNTITFDTKGGMGTYAIVKYPAA